MALTDHDWSSMLAPDSLLPPDVTFLITEEETVEKFPGHRCLLGSISSVFKVGSFDQAWQGVKMILTRNVT